MIALNEFRGIGFVQNVSFYEAKEGKKAYAQLTIEATASIENEKKEKVLVKRYALIDLFDFLAEKASKLSIGNLVYVTTSIQLRNMINNGNEMANGSADNTRSGLQLIGTGLNIISREPTITKAVPTNTWSFNIIGRLGKINRRVTDNPEKKPFANISIATEAPYLDKHKKWQSITQWSYVNLFDAAASEIETYPIGSLIQVSGYVNRVVYKNHNKEEDNNKAKVYFHVLNANRICLLKLKKELEIDITTPPPTLPVMDEN